MRDRRAGVVLAATALLVGCGPSDAMTGNHPIAADQLGPIGTTSTMTGTMVEQSDGCLMLQPEGVAEPLWLVWPAGAKQTDSHPAAVRLANGTSVPAGVAVRVDGQLMTRAGLPDGSNPDSMWGSIAQFCLGETMRDPEIVRAADVMLR